MTASVRPTYIPRTDWRVVPVVLSADQQVALVQLADRERREKEDMAALLIIMALEERGVLPLDWAAVAAWRRHTGPDARPGGDGDAE